MEQQLKNLTDARDILAKAYTFSTNLWPVHQKLWRAIEYIDKQIAPIVDAMLDEEAQVSAE